MKSAAWILTVIFAFLMIQPLFYGFGSTGIGMTKCSKSVATKSSSCQSKCSKPKTQEDKRDCEDDRCNPLLGCPTGNFYVHNYTYILVTSPIMPKQELALFNDNRISKQLTECWHPPEII
jgi:hypothetical protein